MIKKTNNKRVFVVTCHSLVDTTFITRVIINTGHENAHIFILLFQLYYVKCYIWRFVNKSVRSNSSLITNGHPLTPRASWHCLSRSLTDMLCPNRQLSQPYTSTRFLFLSSSYDIVTSPPPHFISPTKQNINI